MDLENRQYVLQLEIFMKQDNIQVELQITM